MKKTLQFLLGFLCCNLLWLLLAAALRTRALPGPIAVYRALPQTLCGAGGHILFSLWRVGMGVSLALLAGGLTGIAMARLPALGRALDPVLYFAYPVPKSALLPVAMLLLGLGDGSKVMIIFFSVVFPVTVAARDAAKETDPALYALARSAGASRWQSFWQITLPALLPALLTSLRLGVGTALALLFLVEGYGTDRGIGYYILDCWSRIDYLGMYGGIVLISLVGALLFLGVDLLAQRLCRWKRV
ncbi:ABC transporter permease [Provencibacterium massiliense]|uniref:ABC transporter permease n=1 Tax=Provencibacterium massiliense TaxID=1841868 RepID=UPI0009A7044E|nr:ABC transporter permease subunit [Provencibacterium massiliense]RGB66784.1 ABC transporter permease subunit [Harryflintia acetispora]